MPILRKRKKFGSILWSFDEALKISTKSVFEGQDKIKDWPLHESQEIIYRVNSINHEQFYHLLIQTTTKLTSLSLKFKLIWALKRYPEDPTKRFAVYIHTKEIQQSELELFHQKRLIIASFGGYNIISREQISEVEFLCSAIEFYERFDNLILPDTSVPFLLYGVKNDLEQTLLFYSDVKGNGMLIKSKSSEDKISPEREIEILRLGSIIGVDVPSKAAVIMLDSEDSLVKQFSSENSNILIQRLIPGSFPLYSATDDDLQNLTINNCRNLGRMLIFDIIAGSWDRHSGNYVLHPKDDNPLKIRYSLAEIDFGHFNPNWYPPADYKEISLEDIDENNPPMTTKREGWALTRHPLVTDMIKNCDQTRVTQGIDQSFTRLKKFIKENNSDLDNYFTSDLLERILNIFKEGTKVRVLFENEITKLNIQLDTTKDIYLL